jgi:hypothetical protein
VTVATGLSAAKTGFDLIKSLRELLGRQDVNPGDIQARLVELQSLMLDAQRALADAEEKNRLLSAKLDEANRIATLRDDMEFVHDGGYYVRKSEEKRVPYCPLCWQVDAKTVPLEPQPVEGSYWCFLHKNEYKTKEGARLAKIQRERW